MTGRTSRWGEKEVKIKEQDRKCEKIVVESNNDSTAMLLFLSFELYLTLVAFLSGSWTFIGIKLF